jgi:hypothetical protein
VRTILAGYILIAGCIIVASKFFQDWIVLTGSIFVCVVIDILLARNIGKLVRKNYE